jgi:hypothetical protein
VLNFKLNITKGLRVILIITIALLHLFSSLLFNLNSINRFSNSNYHDQVLKNNNDTSQSETALTKKDNKDSQTFLSQIEKQKSKSYLIHQIPDNYNYSYSYHNEKNNFYYQKVDNKNLNLRSPPITNYKLQA